MVSRALLTSQTEEWETPQYLFDLWHAQFQFTCDVAATSRNAKCHRYFTKEMNGLSQSWEGERGCRRGVFAAC